MAESIVVTEIVDQDISILEESPMTEGEEKELVIVKTALALPMQTSLSVILPSVLAF